MKSIIIVLDSVGIGADPKAREYGDETANTLINIKKAHPDMKLPNLLKLGLSHIDGCESLADGVREEPTGSFARLMAKSKGKDTTTGHWEIAGLVTYEAFPTYPSGFPASVIEEFEKRTGRKALYNSTASGTEIIAKLGEEQVKTGDLIVYTSADSVFQIAAHEGVVPIEKLYEYCEIAREILQPPHGVARVIARPFKGEPGNFVRTANRHDYSMPPSGPTILDFISKSDLPTFGIGKIFDIFVGAGVNETASTKSNMDGVDTLLEVMKSQDEGLVFVNLVDFDMLYGHRNDSEGYKKALEDFDKRLPEIIGLLEEEDLLYLTADHGCDPTVPGTDHTREYVPLIIYGKKLRAGVNMGTKEGFGHIAVTVLDHLNVKGTLDGESLLGELKK